MNRIRDSRLIRLFTPVALAATWSLTAAAGVRQGGMDSGGGDIHAVDHGAAWFLRDAPVFYCIQVAPDFGVEPATIQKKVRENFDRWIAYIQDRLPNAFDLHPSEGQFRLPLASKFIQSECNHETPLVFYFGVENEKVTQAFQHFDQPIAFSFRETYNPASGRAQGFVWFHKNGLVIEHPASNSQRTLRWERNSNLDLMILHELGHIFGNPHLPGTIMDENLASAFVMSRDSETPVAVPLQIDQRHVLTWPNDPRRFEILGELNAADWGQTLGLPTSSPTLATRVRFLIEDWTQGPEIHFFVATSDGTVERRFHLQRDPQGPNEEGQKLGRTFVVASEHNGQVYRSHYGKFEINLSYTTLVEMSSGAQTLRIPAISVGNGDSILTITGVINSRFKTFFRGETVQILPVR